MGSPETLRGLAAGTPTANIGAVSEPAAPGASPLRVRAKRLQYATIGWNVGEAVLTLALGSAAGSLALIGFGTVSIVEVFASLVVVWHLFDDTGRRDRTPTALRLISAAYGALAFGLVVAAVGDLTGGRRAGESPWGIAYLAVTAVVMFTLAAWKHTTARGLRSEPLRREATITFLDGILSVSTLSGLALNAYLGLWWGDPAAGILVALAAANEARETWVEAAEVS